METDNIAINAFAWDPQSPNRRFARLTLSWRNDVRLKAGKMEENWIQIKNLVISKIRRSPLIKILYFLEN